MSDLIPRPKRKKYIPKPVRGAVLDRQNHKCACGCNEPVGPGHPTRWDHRPPLRIRHINDAGTDYIPAQLDSDYIDALTPKCHDLRTYGGGARSTTKGTDANEIAKARRYEALAEPSDDR